MYKLIKTYPGCTAPLGVVLNTEFTWDSLGNKVFLKDFPDNWQKVQKDYELLAIRANTRNILGKSIFGVIYDKRTTLGADAAVEAYDSGTSYKKGWDIYAVKRLSDGKVLTLGDMTERGRISHFSLYNGIYCHVTTVANGSSCYSGSINNLKPAVFTTKDGKEVYDEDEEVFGVFKNDLTFQIPIKERFRYFKIRELKYWEIFSNKEAAEGYIKMNSDKFFNSTAHAVRSELSKILNIDPHQVEAVVKSVKGGTIETTDGRVFVVNIEQKKENMTSWISRNYDSKLSRLYYKKDGSTTNGKTRNQIEKEYEHIKNTGSNEKNGDN